MHEKYMRESLKQASKAFERGEMPVGVIIVHKDKIISRGYNKKELKKDSTMHAEIIAIRKACNKLNTIDLSNYILYTTCEPCPMCLSAIIWSNIKEVYYACTKKDADDIGFRDNDIYEFIKGNNKLIELKQINREECIGLMKKYLCENKKMY